MGAYVQRRWKDVRVGDCIELECDEFIPADLLLLATSDPHYICYIETANIDGETNLKQRAVVPGIVDNTPPLVRPSHCVHVCMLTHPTCAVIYMYSRYTCTHACTCI